MPPQTRIADWGATLNHQPVIADDLGPSLQNCYKPVRAAGATSTVLVGVSLLTRFTGPNRRRGNASSAPYIG